MTDNILKQDFSHIVPKVSDKFELGAILVSEWGVDQNKAYYYVIVAITEKFVSVLPMNKKAIWNNSGDRAVVPDVIISKYPPVRKKINYQKIDGIMCPYILLESFEDAYLWKGRPTEEDSFTR